MADASGLSALAAGSVVVPLPDALAACVTGAEIHDAIMRFHATVCEEGRYFDTFWQTPSEPPPGHCLGIFWWDKRHTAWHCQMCDARVGFGHLTQERHTNRLKEKLREKAGEFVNTLSGEQRCGQLAHQ
jgi:hypothetical protein